MDINLIVKITSRAWSLKILALMHAGVPGRQAPLLTAMEASRTAFVASLMHLVDLGLVERNPGYGHPLRPEYRLTDRGRAMAAVAARIIAAVPEAEHGVLQRAWTVPVLAVTGRPRHFSGIRTDLGPITDRALSHALGRLEERDWIRRRVNLEDRPLRPTYSAANAGIVVNRALVLPGA